MIESNRILNDENLVSDTINTFFTNVTKSLGIEDNYPLPCYLDDNTTPITKIINTYSNHPSIIKIKENTKIKETFSLNAALEKDIKDITDGIDPSKGISSTIPPKLLKMNNDICHNVGLLSDIKSIKPSKNVGHPYVTDIHQFQYNPNGTLFFNLNYHHNNWEELPHIFNLQRQPASPMYVNQLKISYAKRNDIEAIKQTIPKECHPFYDLIDHHQQ